MSLDNRGYQPESVDLCAQFGSPSLHGPFDSPVLQLNPWFDRTDAFSEEITRQLPATRVPRRVRLTDLIEPNRACLVVGPRQAGKSTLAWSHLADRPPLEVLFLNAEEALVQAWASSPTQVITDLGAQFPTVRTLFIEEAQNLADAGLFIKGLIDARRGYEVLVTGSSSYHLQARTRESLAGRAVRRTLLPLSIEELLAFDPPPVPAVRTERARTLCARQRVIGAYPGVWFHPQPERHLADLIEAFVLRDASDRFAIRRPEAFRRLLMLAAGQVGQMVNYSEWASRLGVSASTVSEWLGLLEETWIIRQVPAFAGGGRREVTAAARLHFYDMGIRNGVLGRFEQDLALRSDSGALAEGWAFGALCKAISREWTVHYWRSKGGAAVDFVLVNGDALIAVEVKAGGRHRVTRSLRSFIDAYHPRCAILASDAYDAVEEEVLNGTPIVHAPLADLERVAAARTAP